MAWRELGLHWGACVVIVAPHARHMKHNITPHAKHKFNVILEQVGVRHLAQGYLQGEQKQGF